MGVWRWYALQNATFIGNIKHDSWPELVGILSDTRFFRQSHLQQLCRWQWHIPPTAILWSAPKILSCHSLALGDRHWGGNGAWKRQHEASERSFGRSLRDSDWFCRSEKDARFLREDATSKIFMLKTMCRETSMVVVAHDKHLSSSCCWLLLMVLSTRFHGVTKTIFKWKVPESSESALESDRLEPSRII